MIYKSAAGRILQSDEDAGIAVAVVNTTNVTDKQGDRVMPGAWTKAIADLRAGRGPKICWHHENGLTSDRFTVIGKATALVELMPGDPALPADIKAAGGGGLIAEMAFNLETEAGRDAFSNVKGGFTDQWSVGFLPEEAEYDRAGGFNGIKSAYPLLEISPVLLGASPMTATLATKSDVSSEEQRRGARFSIDTADGPKFPINDCSDVSDAWKLRGHSDIPQERVERHIRHAAAELGCNGPWNEGKSYSPAQYRALMVDAYGESYKNVYLTALWKKGKKSDTELMMLAAALAALDV